MSEPSPSRAAGREATPGSVGAPASRQSCYALKEELFLEALQRLRRERPAAEIAVAVQGLHLLDWAGSTLHLRVPNAFSRSLFEKAVQPQLEAEMVRLTGSVVRVRLHVETAAAAARDEGRRSRRRRPGDGCPGGLRDFVRDQNNRVAWQMLSGYRHGKALFDPFLLHGPAGCGKTHLVRGFLEAEPSGKPPIAAAYLTAGAFGRAYRANRYRRTVDRFRAEMDAPAVLILDDLQDLANLEGTQREIVRLLERRGDAAGATVFVARDRPERLAGLLPSLATRLQGGMVVGMKPVARESVVTHLKARLGKRGIRLERALLARAAEVANGHPLAAETVVLDALLEARARGRPLTADAVAEAVVAPRPDPGEERLERLAERIAAFFGVTVDDLRMPRKVRRALAPRRLAALALRRAFDLPSAEIGRYLGGRSVSTVAAMLGQARADLAREPTLGDMVEQLVREANPDGS